MNGKVFELDVLRYLPLRFLDYSVTKHICIFNIKGNFLMTVEWAVRSFVDANLHPCGRIHQNPSSSRNSQSEVQPQRSSILVLDNNRLEHLNVRAGTILLFGRKVLSIVVVLRIQLLVSRDTHFCKYLLYDYILDRLDTFIFYRSFLMIWHGGNLTYLS